MWVAVDHELPRSQQVSQSSLDQLRGASGAPSRTHEVVRVRVVLRSHWVIMLPKNGSVVMVSTITHSSSKQISHQGNNFECIRWNLFPMAQAACEDALSHHTNQQFFECFICTYVLHSYQFRGSFLLNHHWFLQTFFTIKLCNVKMAWQSQWENSPRSKAILSTRIL